MRERIAVAALFGVLGIVFGVWVAEVPLVKAGLQLRDSELGLGLLAITGGALFGTQFGGRVARSVGSRHVALASAVLMSLLLPAVVLAPSFLALIPIAFAFGAMAGTLDVAINTLGVAVEGRTGRAIMSSLHGCYSLGALGGAALGGVALASHVPAGPVALAGGVVAALLAASVAGVLPRDPPTPPGTRGFMFPRGRLALLGALAFLASAAEGAIGDWAAIYLHEYLGFPKGADAAGYVSFAVAMTTGRFLGDGLVRRLGPARTLQAGGSLLGAGMAVALTAPAGWLACAGFGLVGLGTANLLPILFSSGARAGGASPGAGIAAVSAVGYLGFLAGPPFIGAAADAFGLWAALTVLVAVGLATLLLAGRAAPGQPDVSNTKAVRSL